MDLFSIFGSLRDSSLLLGLSASRVAIAFLLVPLFTNELIPALVRDAMFISIALLALVMQPAIPAFNRATMPRCRGVFICGSMSAIDQG